MVDSVMKLTDAQIIRVFNRWYKDINASNRCCEHCYTNIAFGDWIETELVFGDLRETIYLHKECYRQMMNEKE